MGYYVDDKNKVWKVECDTCTNKFRPPHLFLEKDAKEELETMGWTLVPIGWRCPACSQPHPL